ncbi:MAG: toll/interleukin-1 receptor domain-containing protein, partial [Rubrivivax sp.]
MDGNANRVFISYRRDDAAGYAGRLEEALERRLGHGSVFRDVLDIKPGEDFIKAIRARLSGAKAVLVLIGPRWAGGDGAGPRRIDDEQDFVRLEVAAALDSGAQVIPVLLPGAEMPTEASLPAPLQALARRNAMSLGDAHWDADIARLADSIGLPKPRSRWPLAAGAVVLAAALAVGWLALRPGAPPAPPPPPPDASARLVGVWVAPVRYAWGDRHSERFEFKRHAGELTGSATFLAYPRAIENLRVEGMNLHFQTRSTSSMNNETRELTRSYAAELRGQPPDEVLAFRMLSSGGFTSEKPLEFEARRL